MSGAVDGGQQQVLASGQSLVAFGDLGIDEVHQTDLLGLVIEGGHVAEAGRAGGGGRQGSLGLGEGRQDVVQGAEVGLDSQRLSAAPETRLHRVGVPPRGTSSNLNGLGRLGAAASHDRLVLLSYHHGLR